MRSPRLSAVLIGLCLLALTGCDGSTASARSPNDPIKVTPTPTVSPGVAVPNLPLAVFDAKSLPGIGAGKITIETHLPAEINVVTFPSDEVGLDYLTQGAGDPKASAEKMAAEAHQNVTVSLTPEPGGARITAGAPPSRANPHDQIILHVRVKYGASLDIKALQGGNINVVGQVVSVTAYAPVGTITVKGAIGRLELTTGNGSINVDSYAMNSQGPMPPLKLQANNGDINLFAVSANISADTTAGNIHFVGSLWGSDNSFSTTGNGQILMTMPDDISYHFEANTRGNIVADFPPSTLICAVMHSANISLHTNYSADTKMGQITVSGAGTPPTSTFESAIVSPNGRRYIYFETNRSEVTRLYPGNEAQPNGDNVAQNWWPAEECKAVDLQQQAKGSDVSARLNAEAGAVTMRLIRKQSP